MPADILEESAATMREQDRGAAVPRRRIKRRPWRPLKRGHLSHPVGMSVHDVGDYSNAPLEAGMVFSWTP